MFLKSSKEFYEFEREIELHLLSFIKHFVIKFQKKSPKENNESFSFSASKG